MDPATKETFPEANLLLKAPPGEEDRVYDLAVHRYELGFISQWQPTEQERAAIAAGGPVWVSVWCQGGPPPIAVFGVTPFLTRVERETPTEAEIDEVLRGLESGTMAAQGRCACGESLAKAVLVVTHMDDGTVLWHGTARCPKCGKVHGAQKS